MSENVNSDFWSGTLRYWRCGVAAPDPDPVGTVIGWTQKLFVDEIPDEPDPFSHEEMRWARVVARLAAKHR